MDMFEYVAVLTSIIIGLGIAHLLRGLTQLIQHPEQAGVSFVHLCWVAYTFLLTVFWWWWEFRLGTMEVWTFGVYLFVILYAVLIFVLCSLLFPASISGFDGLKGYFFAKRAWFFGIFIFLQFIDTGDTLLKGMEYFHSLGIEYSISKVAQILLSAVAIVTRNEKFHGFFAIAALAYMASQAFRYYGTVG